MLCYLGSLQSTPQEQCWRSVLRRWSEALESEAAVLRELVRICVDE
jgi:hypothetical protein